MPLGLLVHNLSINKDLEAQLCGLVKVGVSIHKTLA